MNSITLTGVASNNPGDDRTKLIINVTYENELFNWELRMPPIFTGSFQEYVDLNADNVYADIAAKLQQWVELDPKTRVIEDMMGEDITVPISREEIVKPTYPDYYVLRAREYPNTSEQLDAFWKGEASIQDMTAKIATIKAKYPKK